MQNKPIMLFSGQDFYPSGGWDDFKGYFENALAAQRWLSENEPDASYKWAHIVENNKIISIGFGTDSLNDSEWIWDNE